MKKYLTPFICLMALLLSSCTFTFDSSSSEGSSSETTSSTFPSSEEIPSSSEEPSTEEPSSEEPSSGEPSSSEEISSQEPSSEEPKVVKKHQVFDEATNYVVGDNFYTDNHLKVKVTFTDNTTEIREVEQLQITSIREKKSGLVIEENSRFVNSGDYEVFYSYAFDSITRNTKITVNVLSGYEAGLNLLNLTISGLDYVISKTILETSGALSFVASWENGVEETLVYSEHMDAITLSLFENGNNINVIDQPIQQEKEYVLQGFLNNYREIIASEAFSTPVALGYYTLEQGDIIYSDLHKVSPHKGPANMLVVPIEIPWETAANAAHTFTDESIEFIETAFFGAKEDTPNEWNSLKSYFETTSLNFVEISGMIGPVYRPSVDKYSIESVKDSYNELHKLFNDAIKYVKNNSGINDWSEYDLNNDGYFDNLHFITNAVYNSYDSVLWPHKWEMRNYPGTSESPNGYVYETTSLGHFTNARTIIHEQSHMFGIPDYYDYSYSGVDYIGAYDMQSHNVFDWNSWSKFSVGWTSAKVIDGTLDSTTVSLRSAALYNECIVIPANVSTYNNSAFDEFFLIELFTKDANNYDDWSKISTLPTRTAGIRLYHVDARLYESYQGIEVVDKEHISQIKANGQYADIDVGVNNSYTYTDYAVPGNPAWSDFKILSLIQKGGTDTFGNYKDNGGNIDFLSYGDLFVTGDQFTFAKYKHFLRKSSRTVNTMDNGEIFPYTIDFVSVTQQEAVIRISK